MKLTAVSLWLAAMACLGNTSVLAVSETKKNAEVAADHSQAAFDTTDYDGDKKISFEEYRNRTMHIFDDMDHNDDDRIAGNEHPTALTADGKEVRPNDVSVHDFQVALRGYFNAADSDKDGFLTLSEWKAETSAKSN